MAGNFWTEDEIIKRVSSGEIRQPEYDQKWTLLKQGEHGTLCAADVGAPSGYPMHVHREHDEVIVILEGGGEVVLGDENRVVKKGDVFFVPKGTPHTTRFSCKCVGFYSPSFDMANPDRAIVE